MVWRYQQPRDEDDGEEAVKVGAEGTVLQGEVVKQARAVRAERAVGLHRRARAAVWCAWVLYAAWRKRLAGERMQGRKADASNLEKILVGAPVVFHTGIHGGVVRVAQEIGERGRADGRVRRGRNGGQQQEGVDGAHCRKKL